VIEYSGLILVTLYVFILCRARYCLFSIICSIPGELCGLYLLLAGAWIASVLLLCFEGFTFHK